MDGEAVPMDALFSNGRLLPPAHPQCRCAVEYEEIPMPTQAASGGTGLGNFLEGHTDRQWASVGGAGKEGLDTKDDGKMPRNKKHGYDDITGHWYPDATPGSHIVEDADEVTVNGVTYKVDGRNVQLSYSPHEKEVAEILEREIGGELKMLPRVNIPQGIRTPDYLFNGKSYDLKSIIGKGKNTIYDVVARKPKQAENFIIDVTDCPLDEIEIERQISDIYYSLHTKFVKEIVIIKDSKIQRVFTRKA